MGSSTSSLLDHGPRPSGDLVEAIGQVVEVVGKSVNRSVNWEEGSRLEESEWMMEKATSRMEGRWSMSGLRTVRTRFELGGLGGRRGW